MDQNEISIEIGSTLIKLSTNKVARQANGSVMLSCGDTVLLSTACMAKNDSDTDFFPLTVHYQEKFSSAGKTLGGFIKREGRPSEKETLTSRMIDRPIRPLFPEGFNRETQILSYVLSYDREHQPEALAIVGASAALAVSDIPFSHTLAGVRVGRIDGEFVLNPNLEQQEKSDLDLLLAGTENAILMIEGYCDFLTEEEVIDAINFGHEPIKKICQAIDDWAKVVGKEKIAVQENPHIAMWKDKILSSFNDDIYTSLFIKDKKEREKSLEQLSEKISTELLTDPESEEAPFFSPGYKKARAHILRQAILKEKKRVDGRSLTDVRKISVEAPFLPSPHGSALFTRGETQSIAVCTLGSDTMGQRYETLEGDAKHSFYLQYSFPPYSVGEVGRIASAGRREIGHGKLAEKSLKSVLPAADDFPYVIRLESNITESNGSSSMASVCGGCLAMMDCGVPIKRPISGIAMGLVLEGKEFGILSDILGLEDALGDMDFKITGDDKGITAFQMDIKVEGITSEIMLSALLQAKEGRTHILEEMKKSLPEHRKNLSSNAPRMHKLKIKPSKIGALIGPGGKMIKSIIEETGVEIDISDEGIVSFLSNSEEDLNKALSKVEDVVAEVEVGKTYHGEITSIKEFGAFIKLPGNCEGLLHISQISHDRVEKVEDVLKPKQKLDVKVIDINDRNQIKLSRKALIKK